MCGIAGQIRRDAPVERATIAAMTSLQGHRGPDSEGFWYSHDHHVGLGHRRLSILDLSPRGLQPMISPDGRYVIVFNGEIYNFRAARRIYEQAGETFVSDSDTEVLLRGWALEGLASLSRFRGMYAFAVWDSAERILTLARDPLGIKPLYYSAGEQQVTFASEIPALRLAVSGDDWDPAGLGVFLRWGSVPAPLTVFRKLRALEPGSIFSWCQDTGSGQARRFWDLSRAWRASHEQAKSFRSEGEAVEWARAALVSSIQAHLTSDVPVGTFLSGGVDSTAVVALSAEAGAAVETFSLGSEDPTLDELSEARAIAQWFGTVHHERRIGLEEFSVLVSAFLDSLNQPTIDGFNTFAVSRFAHEHGFKVVTSGVGGDELFRGYTRSFQRVPRVQRVLAAVPPSVRRTATQVLRRGEQRWPSHSRSRLATLLAERADLRAVYLWSRALFPSSDAAGLFSEPDLGREASAVDVTRFVPNTLPPPASHLASISGFEIGRYLGPQLLADSDTFSMANGLELRVPLADATLYEQLLGLPDRWFRGDGRTPKSLLVAAARLPTHLLTAKKRGFALPFHRWLRAFPETTSSGLLDRAAISSVATQVKRGERHWSALWALVVLEHFAARTSSVPGARLI